MTIERYLVADTRSFTWVSSGATASPISSSIISGSETIVNSMSAVDSGNGHYFANHTIPNTPGFYVNRWIAVVTANTYKREQCFKAVLGEVD